MILYFLKKLGTITRRILLILEQRQQIQLSLRRRQEIHPIVSQDMIAIKFYFYLHHTVSYLSFCNSAESSSIDTLVKNVYC